MWQATRLPSGVVEHWALADPDALLDDLTQAEFDRNDGRMPYWATVWPAALSLADAVLRGPGLAGQRVLDLGCGLGLVGLAALSRGAHVTLLDWEAEAVSLALSSAWANGYGAVEALPCDWRAPPPLAPFDLILAADVLYEERNAPAVAAFLAAHLAPGAQAWIADPDRHHAKGFDLVAVAAGLEVLARVPQPTIEGASRVTCWRLGRAGDATPASGAPPRTGGG